MKKNEIEVLIFCVDIHNEDNEVPTQKNNSFIF